MKTNPIFFSFNRVTAGKEEVQRKRCGGAAAAAAATAVHGAKNKMAVVHKAFLTV